MNHCDGYRKQHGDWVYCGRIIWPWQKSRMEFYMNHTHERQDVRIVHEDHKTWEQFKAWTKGESTL